MNENQATRDDLKQVKRGSGKRTAYLVGAVAAVAVVIGAFVASTRGTDVERSSAAMAEVPENQPATTEDAGAEPNR